jgi:trans-aconitate methyltransferase
LAKKGSRQAHWDAAYQRLSPSGVSWFQPDGGFSVELVEALQLPRDTPVIDLGGGASSFVDELVRRGYSDVTVLDLSGTALSMARERLGAAAPVTWIHEDLLRWVPRRQYGLWHDRAVFHFLTLATDRRAYLDKLGATVAPAGYAVLATFAPDGPEQCSGLPVARYGPEDLTDALASVGLQVVGVAREEHRTPSGVIQPFTWVVAVAP